jgi:prepilin-type N-terminal cleavage/methylation domain-containing protein
MAETTETTTGGAARPQDGGFTLIEVVVAMAILLVGALGVLTCITVGYASTGRTTSREQGTNIARDLVERARQIGYSQSTMSSAPGALRASLPASDAATASPSDPLVFTMVRRGTTYTVRVFACSLDDPSNGVGVGNATFCAPNSTVPPPTPNPTPTPAAAVNVLGVAVAAGGSVLGTVCNAVGTDTSLLNTVTGLVGGALSAAGGASVQVCPGPAGTTVPVQYGTPDDFHRVRVDVSWTRGGAGSVSQTTLLPNPS